MTFILALITLAVRCAVMFGQIRLTATGSIVARDVRSVSPCLKLSSAQACCLFIEQQFIILITKVKLVLGRYLLG